MKKVRKLKIYSKSQHRTYEYVHVPSIRLEGRWLEKAGFRQGMKVKVLIEENKLTIMIDKEQK